MSRGINLAESIQKSYSSFQHKKPVVFLSHKNEDKDFVEAIGEYLMKAGIDIYLDKRDFRLQRAVSNGNDKEITECIQIGISKSDYILCFVSEKTKESWWVPYEIGYGKKANKGIASLVKKDVVEVPSYLLIEPVIQDIDDINSYIKKITSSSNIVLHEKYSWETEVAEHITKNSLSHELAKYLHNYKR